MFMTVCFGCNCSGTYTSYLPCNTWDRLEVCNQIDLLNAHVAKEDCLPTALEQQELIKGLEDVQGGLWAG